MSDKPTSPSSAPATSSTTPSAAPGRAPTPASAVRMARIGGTVAEAAAAAISAHTLYHLGGQLDLGPWTAWLLPTALDVYSFTALAVAYSLPSHHPGQRIVLRTARLAFAMTLGCNALDHFLAKAGRLVDPTVRDLLLVAVATLPPLVVERLLNLQSLLVGHRTTPAVQDSEDEPVQNHDGRPVDQGILAHGAPPDQSKSDVTTQEGQRPKITTADQAPLRALSRQDRTAESAAVFTDLSARLGRRPSAREFQRELAASTRTLIAEGRLPAGTRPPSITTVKRIRAAIEAAPLADCTQAEAEHNNSTQLPSASRNVKAVPALDRLGEGPESATMVRGARDD